MPTPPTVGPMTIITPSHEFLKSSSIKHEFCPVGWLLKPMKEQLITYLPVMKLLRGGHILPHKLAL